MARAVVTDFLHNMRFHVGIDDGVQSWLAPTAIDSKLKQAGFSACTIPEATVDAVEYREGTFVYTRKFPGIPTMSDVTLSRGVSRSDTAFYSWIKAVMEGEGAYRADVVIDHFHRDNALKSTQDTIALDKPGRKYKLYEAFPIRHKVAADLDATATEISIMELDLSYEYFDVTSVAA